MSPNALSLRLQDCARKAHQGSSKQKAQQLTMDDFIGDDGLPTTTMTTTSPINLIPWP